LPVKHNLKSKMSLKYLLMRFTIIQCGGPAFDMNWLTVLTAIAISTLVTIIAYIRIDTPALLWNNFHLHFHIHKLLIQKF
jgi:hypothetical protein